MLPLQLWIILLFCPSTLLEIPRASHHRFLFSFLPPSSQIVSPLLLSLQVPAPSHFPASTGQSGKQTAAKANQKPQPATEEEQKAKPQARRQRSERRHSQLGNGAARSQKDSEGLTWKNRKGRRKHQRYLHQIWWKRGKKTHTKKQNSKSVYHNETETAVLPIWHTWLSRETVRFLCPKYFTGIGMQFRSLSEKHCYNSSTFLVCSTLCRLRLGNIYMKEYTERANEMEKMCVPRSRVILV